MIRAPTSAKTLVLANNLRRLERRAKAMKRAVPKATSPVSTTKK